MILDDIVEKRKEQLQREKDNIEPQVEGNGVKFQE